MKTVKLIEVNWEMKIASHWKEYEVTIEEYSKIKDQKIKTVFSEWVFIFWDSEYKDVIEKEEKELEIKSIENKLLKLSSEKKWAEELIAMWVGIEIYTEKLEAINSEMSELVGQLQQLIK